MCASQEEQCSGQCGGNWSPYYQEATDLNVNTVPSAANAVKHEMFYQCLLSPSSCANTVEEKWLAGFGIQRETSQSDKDFLQLAA